MKSMAIQSHTNIVDTFTMVCMKGSFNALQATESQNEDRACKAAYILRQFVKGNRTFFMLKPRTVTYDIASTAENRYKEALFIS